MRMNNIFKMSDRDRRISFLMIIFSLAILTFVFWFTISPFSYKDNLTICHYNNTVQSGFSECMQPYWNQFKIASPAVNILLGLILASLVILIITEIKGKFRR